MTDAPRLGLLLYSGFVLLLPSSIWAQVPTVLQGRVEDAATRQPVEGARVFSADSSSAVLTDSLGAFSLQLRGADDLSVHVARIGYLEQRFDLPPEAVVRVSVLLLEPAAIAIQGVDVTVEAAIEVLQRNLANRRNAYPHAMRAFDRGWLDRFAPIGSVYDLVRQTLPETFPCYLDSSQLCRRGRARTFTNPYPTVTLAVCVDGRKSIAPISELDMIPVDNVALVELYRRNGIKVYTSDWMLRQARIGWTAVMPDPPGGLSC